MPNDYHQLRRFFKRELLMVRLAGVTFYCNPQSWSEDTERLHNEVQTVAGIARFDFGIKPTTYSLYGTTGTRGVDEIARMETAFGLRTNGGAPIPLEFLYPYVFDYGTGHPRHVYIDRFKKEGSPEGGQLYHWYTLDLWEPPPNQLQAATALPDSAGLAVGLIPPG